MTLLKIRAFAPTTAGSGMSISLSETKAGQFVRLGISEAAQREFFGGPLDPAKDIIAISISDAPGKTHLMGLAVSDTQDADALPITISPRGAVALRLMPWRQVPAGKLPARSMQIANTPKTGEVVVKLPEWARPDPRKIGQGRSLME